jgi:hypothetical protein
MNVSDDVAIAMLSFSFQKNGLGRNIAEAGNAFYLRPYTTFCRLGLQIMPLDAAHL